jgi:hypothetical protein
MTTVRDVVLEAERDYRESLQLDFTHPIRQQARLLRRRILAEAVERGVGYRELARLIKRSPGTIWQLTRPHRQRSALDQEWF